MKIKDELYKLQDLKYRDFSLKLLPKDTNLIGVRIPILRKLSKNIELYDLTNDTFEEVMLKGMVIARIKDFNLLVKECDKFLVQINNWSICDSFVASLNIVKNNKKEMLNYLYSKINSKEEYIRRFILVTLLWYYIDDEYIKDIINILSKIKSDEYYVKMAYAWCVCEIYFYNKDLALDIMKNLKEEKEWIFNKVISKIKDSKKITIEDKQMLDSLKKERKSVYEGIVVL